jgi:hypothetical protein
MCERHASPLPKVLQSLVPNPQAKWLPSLPHCAASELILVDPVEHVQLFKQAASSKQQQARAPNGQKSKLRHGASDSAELLVDDGYACAVSPKG